MSSLPNDTYIERVLELQPGTLRVHRQKPEISPPELTVLLHLVELYPWLLEVAEARFNAVEARRILVRESLALPPNASPADQEANRLLREGVAEALVAAVPASVPTPAPAAPRGLDFDVPGPDPGLNPEPHNPVKVLSRPPNRDDVLHVYTDGACQGNPGPMGIGVVLLDRLPRANPPRRELSEGIGRGTNNVAELTAVLRGLEAIHPQHRGRPVVVYSDSTYVIGVLARGWTAKANTDLVDRIRQKIEEFAEVYFVKVPAHSGVMENERADLLAKRGVTANSQLPSGRSPR